jgi:hypothetical protein
MKGDQTEATISTTYFAGLESIFDPDEADRVIGVVRNPHDWVDDAVDRNIPALAPRRDTRAAFKAVRDALEKDGKPNPTALAWSEQNVGVESQYRDRLSRNGVRQVLGELVDRLEHGDDVVLVARRKNARFCHRRVLAEELADRVDVDAPVVHYPAPYEPDVDDEQVDGPTETTLENFKTDATTN